MVFLETTTAATLLPTSQATSRIRLLRSLINNEQFTFLLKWVTTTTSTTTIIMGTIPLIMVTIILIMVTILLTMVITILITLDHHRHLKDHTLEGRHHPFITIIHLTDGHMGNAFVA